MNKETNLISSVETEEEARQLIERLRWKDGFICPGCGYRRGYKLSSRSVTECAKCKKQTSATAGTIFHGAKKIMPWIKGLKAILENEIYSANSTAKLLQERYATFWAIRQKIRLSLSELVRKTKSLRFSFSCSQIRKAFTKLSSESRETSTSETFETIKNQINETTNSYSDSTLSKAFEQHLLASHTGISRKYAQLYATEYSFIQIKQSCRLERALNTLLESRPFTGQMISDYKSPYLVLIHCNSPT